MKKTDKEIYQWITGYGQEVLSSEAFKKASSQPHHIRSSVDDHTLNVCIMSLRMCQLLERLHINVDEKALTQAALCHDLGMVGRGQQYHGLLNSWRSHAESSAMIAREIIPGISDKVENSILSHMWPAFSSRPDSREAVILSAADKWASLADWMTILTGHAYKASLKSRILRRSVSVRPDSE